MILIKKYKNRKLYDTTLSRYITLKDINAYIKSGHEIKVMSSPSNNDITYNVMMMALFVDMQENNTVSKKTLTQLVKNGTIL